MRSNSIIHSNSIMKPLNRFVIEGHGDGGNLNTILLARKKLRNKNEVSVAAASVAPERVEASAAAPRAMAGKVEVSATTLSATVTGAVVSAATPNAVVEVNSSWYLKATERVELEIVANEFGRLVISRQPKTRLVQAGVGGKRYVASKKVVGFTPFSSMNTSQLWEGFANNQYNGLAAVCIYALLVNEYDMHMGNVGLDANNQAVKIDGDHDFISILALHRGRSINHEGQQITAQVLADLPMVFHYKPANWLDKNERKGNLNSNDLIAIQQSPHFREEMFHTILCYLVLPDKLIQAFVNQYFPEDISLTISLTTEIQSRLEQLKVAAFGLPEFITFLQSNRASTTIENYWHHLSDFSCVGKIPLVKQVALTRVKLLTRLTHLRTECHTIRPISPPIFDLQSVDDLISIMPNLSQASMRRDFERYDCIEQHFLLRVEQMVVGGLLSDSDKDRLVDEAHHHDLQAFGMLYYTLQTKANKNKFVPFGFYKLLVMLLRQFINAQRMSEALQYANQIEDLLLQYQSRFVALSDMSTGLGEVSELINWRTLSMFDQALSDDNKRQQFLHWRKSDVRIEKIFFRLGFHDSMLAIKNLSPDFFVGELDSSLILREIHSEGQYKNRYTAYDFPFLKEYLREKYLKRTDQSIFGRVGGGSTCYANRADVEAYIEKNREALACSRQLPLLADHLFIQSLSNLK